MARNTRRIVFAIVLAVSAVMSSRAWSSQDSAPSDRPSDATQWRAIEKTGTVAKIRSFLDTYPSSAYTRDAELRLATLLAKGEIAVPEVKAVPGRSSPRLSCTLLPYVLRGTLVQQSTLGRPEDGTEVAVTRTPSGVKVGTVLFTSSGEAILLGHTVRAVAEHRGDLINTTLGQVMDGGSFSSTAGSVCGYWTDVAEDWKGANGLFRWIEGHAPQMYAAWWLFLDGNIHRFRGAVDILGTTFTGNDEDPLTLAITQRGYVYLHGKGSVTTADGKQRAFPRSTPRK